MDDKYSSENHEIITEKTESTQNEGAGTEGFEPEKSPIHKSNGEITPIVISNYSNGIIEGEQQAYEQPNTSIQPPLGGRWHRGFVRDDGRSPRAL